MKAKVRPKSIIIKKIHPIVLINPAAINIPKNQAANAISIAITARKIIAANTNILSKWKISYWDFIYRSISRYNKKI